MSSSGTAFTFDHAGYQLAGLKWAPTADALGRTLLILHGLGEHGERYAHMAEHFSALGYHVYTYDHEGHGRSEGKRGTIRDWPLFTAGITSCLAAVQAEAPNNGVWLYGHSMGAAVALDFCLYRDASELVRGVIASAPPVKLGFTPNPVLTSMAGFAARLAPNVTKSNEINPADLSRDAGVVSLYRVNPLNHDRVSMRLGNSLLDAPKRWLQANHYVEVPLLIMHGTADAIADIAGTRTFAANLKGDVSLREWVGFFHELHNEPEQLEVFSTVATWIDSKAKTNR